MFNLSVEEVAGKGAAPVSWPRNTVLATWDDTMEPVEVKTAGTAPDSTFATLQLPEGMRTQGVRRFVYPATLCGGQDQVVIPSVQNGRDFPQGMPLYAETRDGGADVLFKSLCGVLRLQLTTDVRLASVRVSTEDTVFMTGRFGVGNYPFPVLNAASGAEKYAVCEGLQAVDFAQGADLNLYVAPNCYNTFTVTLVAEDGRTCVKNLKEDKYVVVERNAVCTIRLGGEEGELVFE